MSVAFFSSICSVTIHNSLRKSKLINKISFFFRQLTPVIFMYCPFQNGELNWFMHKPAGVLFNDPSKVIKCKHTGDNLMYLSEFLWPNLVILCKLGNNVFKNQNRIQKRTGAFGPCTECGLTASQKVLRCNFILPSSLVMLAANKQISPTALG